MNSKYPLGDWQYEVANGDTKLGYEDWVEHRRQSDEEVYVTTGIVQTRTWTPGDDYLVVQVQVPELRFKVSQEVVVTIRRSDNARHRGRTWTQGPHDPQDCPWPEGNTSG